MRHSKPTEVVEEVKAQLKEKVQPANNPLADVIIAAGKEKLSKKPDDKQSTLTSKHAQTVYHTVFMSNVLHWTAKCNILLLSSFAVPC